MNKLIKSLYYEIEELIEKEEYSKIEVILQRHIENISYCGTTTGLTIMTAMIGDWENIENFEEFSNVFGEALKNRYGKQMSKTMLEGLV